MISREETLEALTEQTRRTSLLTSETEEQEAVVEDSEEELLEE